jgi:hypothetical protein
MISIKINHLISTNVTIAFLIFQEEVSLSISYYIAKI